MKATIHFEKGKSFWEYVIMGVMAEKQKRLNMPINPFSHDAIVVGNYRYTTHPKKGLIKEDWTPRPPDPNRLEIEVEVDAVHIENMYQKFKGKPYNYLSIFQSLRKFLTGKWIGKEPTKLNCAQWVAYCLNIRQWWKYDLVDLQRYIEAEKYANSILRKIK